MSVRGSLADLRKMTGVNGIGSSRGWDWPSNEIQGWPGRDQGPSPAKLVDHLLVGECQSRGLRTISLK